MYAHHIRWRKRWRTKSCLTFLCDGRVIKVFSEPLEFKSRSPSAEGSLAGNLRLNYLSSTSESCSFGSYSCSYPHWSQDANHWQRFATFLLDEIFAHSCIFVKRVHWIFSQIYSRWRAGHAVILLANQLKGIMTVLWCKAMQSPLHTVPTSTSPVDFFRLSR